MVSTPLCCDTIINPPATRAPDLVVPGWDRGDQERDSRAECADLRRPAPIMKV